MKTFNRFSLLCLFLAIIALAASSPSHFLLAPRAAQAQDLESKKIVRSFRPHKTSWIR